MPRQLQRNVKTIATKRGFDSVSRYIQYLIDLDKELISEAKILAAARQARKEYSAGKTVTAKSLADLL